MSSQDITAPTPPGLSTARDQTGVPLARPARVELPPAKSEERLAVKMSDFNRVREAVRGMADPMVHPSEWATTFFGAFLAFGIAFLTLPGAPHGQHDYHRVIFGLLAVMSAILALFMAWIEKKDRRSRRKERDRICGDMDTVESESPRLVTETTLTEEAVTK
jgi:hypothetical protein